MAGCLVKYEKLSLKHCSKILAGAVVVRDVRVCGTSGRGPFEFSMV